MGGGEQRNASLKFQRNNKMARVRFSGPTNSTLFTTCCGCAICDDQSKCPCCGEEVPYTPRQRWDMAMANQVGGWENLRRLRKSYRSNNECR